jgi:putative transposase
MSTRERLRTLRGQGFPVPVIAAAVGVSRSRAYAVLREKPPAPQADPDAITKSRLRELAGEFPTYGYRRLTVWLNRRFGQQVNRKRVLRLCRELGILVTVRQRRAKRREVRGRIEVSASDEHWQADMTKVWCGSDGWGYLFGVIDAYDRELIGYRFSLTCRTDDLLSALDDALLYRFAQGPSPGLALRTDNGPQMTSRRFRGALAACDITHERTGYNNPDGDAYIERFFRTLKEEEVWLHDYGSFAEASEAIARFIAYYNAERPHQALGYRSPQEFRAQQARSLLTKAA